VHEQECDRARERAERGSDERKRRARAAEIVFINKQETAEWQPRQEADRGAESAQLSAEP
jgi:hypothetical protein